MNIIEIERSFAVFFAEKLEMELDREIFRGAIPTGVESGAAVRLAGCLNDVAPSTANWRLQILGKFADRDDALSFTAKLIDMLPLFGAQLSGFRAAAITPEAWGDPYPASDGGRIKYFASINLNVSF